jgi:hypothetical protein
VIDLHEAFDNESARRVILRTLDVLEFVGERCQ